MKELKNKLLAVVDEELKEVRANISNGEIWLKGAQSEEDVELLESNLVVLREKEQKLIALMKRIDEDEEFDI
jgi:hypothetical protein